MENFNLLLNLDKAAAANGSFITFTGSVHNNSPLETIKEIVQELCIRI